MNKAISNRQLFATSARVAKDVDSAGIVRQRLLIYGGTGGGEIWLREDQSLSQCMSTLGLNRDLVPETCGDKGFRVDEVKFYRKAFSNAKALYCWHPDIVTSAENYFAELMSGLEFRISHHNASTEAGRTLTFKKGSLYFRIDGGVFVCHGQLEIPKERAERALRFIFQSSPNDIGYERLATPIPTFSDTGRLVWMENGAEVRPDDIAASIIRIVAGKH